MKKAIYTTTFVILIWIVSFGQVQGQKTTYVSKNNGTTEYLHTTYPLAFFYSSSKNPKQIELKSVGGDMMTNIYKVSFPNDIKVYVLKMEGNKIICTNPDGTKQTFVKQEEGTYWEGYINGNLKIQMYLNFVGNEGKIQKFEGWYYYESQGSKHKIKLKGTSYMNVFNLKEFVNGKKTGEIKLDSSEGMWLTGQWKGANGKTFPIKIKGK